MRRGSYENSLLGGYSSRQLVKGVGEGSENGVQPRGLVYKMLRFNFLRRE